MSKRPRSDDTEKKNGSEDDPTHHTFTVTDTGMGMGADAEGIPPAKRRDTAEENVQKLIEAQTAIEVVYLMASHARDNLKTFCLVNTDDSPHVGTIKRLKDDLTRANAAQEAEILAEREKSQFVTDALSVAAQSDAIALGKLG
jgi:hypothetical protein